MSLFKFFFDQNTKKWIAKYPVSKYEEEMGTIVKNFMVQDNISFEKYHANLKWESYYLSMYVNDADLVYCSPTYRDFYSSFTNKRNLNNAELGYRNTWFYLAYPDVAKWAEENYDDIKEYLNGLNYDYQPYFPDNLQILRFMVSMYQKEKKKKLECAI